MRNHLHDKFVEHSSEVYYGVSSEYAAKTIIKGERQLGLGLMVEIRVSVSTLKVCCGWKSFVSFLHTFPLN
jgi:hypothetical protein